MPRTMLATRRLLPQFSLSREFSRIEHATGVAIDLEESEGTEFETAVVIVVVRKNSFHIAALLVFFGK